VVHSGINQCKTPPACFTAFRPLINPTLPQLSQFPISQTKPQPQLTIQRHDETSASRTLASYEDAVSARTSSPASSCNPIPDSSQPNEADIDDLPRLPSAAHALRHHVHWSQGPEAAPEAPEAPGTEEPVEVHGSPSLCANKSGTEDASFQDVTESDKAASIPTDSTCLSPRPDRDFNSVKTPAQQIKVYTTPPLPVNADLEPSKGSKISACVLPSAGNQDPPATDVVAQHTATHSTPCNVQAAGSGSGSGKPITVLMTPPIVVNFDKGTEKSRNPVPSGSMSQRRTAAGAATRSWQQDQRCSCTPFHLSPSTN
jgi:hypothetical protein